MLDFTWNMFKETGSIDMYLLFKEIQIDHHGPVEEVAEDLADVNFPIS
ncbi:YqzL family protein [Bacillus testis]|nr:YqzL family protein [Bacillus testis]